MIDFAWKDFEEADKKLDELYTEEWRLTKELAEIRTKRSIAEEERNFIGDWLKRNGATTEECEMIDDAVAKPTTH